MSTRSGESQATSFAKVLKTYVEDQIRVTDLLLNEPERYVNTLNYLDAARNTLPVPITSVELGDDFVVPVDTFPVNDAIRIPWQLEKNGVRGWNRCVMDHHVPPRPDLLDAVLDLEFICKICDVACSDEALRPGDSEIFLTSIEKECGLVPVFVF